MSRRKQAEDLGAEHFRCQKAGAEALGEAGVVRAEALWGQPTLLGGHTAQHKQGGRRERDGRLEMKF